MPTHLDELRSRFAEFSDEEILRRWSDGVLSDEAQAVARLEARTRGVALPPYPGSEASEIEPEPPAQYLGDMEIVAKGLSPMAAHILAERLCALGIPATSGDTHTVRMNPLISIALGGAKVRVPSAYKEETLALIASIRRGDFSLKKSFNVEDPDESN